MTRVSRTTVTRAGVLAAAAALLLVSVMATGRLAAAGTTPSGGAAPSDPLVALYGQVSGYSAADYTASSWAPFSATRDAVAKVVQARGADAAARARLQD